MFTRNKKEIQMNITRDDAVALFSALGINTANKWNAKRMAAKLQKIDEMVDEDTTLDGDEEKTLAQVLVAIENEEEITVDAEEPKKPVAKGKVTKKPTKKEIPEKDEDEEDEEPKKPVAKGNAAQGKNSNKAAPKKEAKAKEPKKASTTGVREVVTRPYLAGQIIAKYGLAAGVTDDMVSELDDAYGKVNPAESLFTLRNAWHAIRGYTTK
jgi:outer membrane biosynthesis protein TonB